MTAAIFAFYLLCIPITAHAQMSLPTINPMVMTTFAKQDVLSQHLMQLEREQGDDAPADDGEVGTSMSGLTFRSDPSRTQQNLRNFVARTPGEEGKAALRQLVASQPRIIEEVSVSLAPYGLDASNVGDAYALWWMNAWLVSEKRDEDPDAATIQSVKEQVYRSFLQQKRWWEQAMPKSRNWLKHSCCRLKFSPVPWIS
ncbi:MAG: hypothetical protein AAF494_11995 [Pseudomonadota bacterium]